MEQPIATAKADTPRNRTFDATQFSANALTKDRKLMMNTTSQPLPAVEGVAASLATAIADGRRDQEIDHCQRRPVALMVHLPASATPLANG